MKVAATVIGGILVFLAVIVGLTEFGYRLDSHYQPLQEQVRAKTFAQSFTYNEGMIRDLQNMRMQYMSPDLSAQQKDAIAQTVKQRYAGYDNSKLPADLQAFLGQIGAN